MRTHIHHLTAAAVAALIALATPAAATEYEASDYLPLAVGNSWTLGHGVYDFSDRLATTRQSSCEDCPSPCSLGAGR